MAQTIINEEQQQQDGDKMQASNKTQSAAAAAKMKPSYKHIPHSQKPPHLVAKRNARERRRVQAVNQAFYKLRKSVPIENRNKRVSKVKTLQRAIDYIRKLEMILAEDEAAGQARGAVAAADCGGSALACHPNQTQAGPKLQRESAPLQQQQQGQLTNSSSYNKQDGQLPPPPSQKREQQTKATSGGQLQAENGEAASKESRAKQRPDKRSEQLVEMAAAGEIGAVKKQPRLAGATAAGQRQRRGRKPTGNNKLTGDLQQNNHQDNHHQLARDPRAQCGLETATTTTPQDDNNYGSLRTTMGIDGPATTGHQQQSSDPNLLPATSTTANVYFPTSATGVSYGRPRDTTTTTTTATSLVAASAAHHYPNHHYHYYMDLPASEQHHPQNHHQLAYSHHNLQLPPDGHRQQQQRVGGLNGEISSSSLSSSTATKHGPSVFDYSQASYQYASNCSPLDQSAASQVGSNQQQCHINHDPFVSLVDSPSSSTLGPSQQAGYPPPEARHHQTSSWHPQQQQQQQQQQPATVLSDRTDLTLLHSHESDKTHANKTHPGVRATDFAPFPLRSNRQPKLNDYEQKPAVVAADSTSSTRAQRGLQPHQKPPVGIDSPPVSICSSSSLSPSTTLKSLDLSGGSSGGGGCSSSTSGPMFSSASSSNGSDKSPTTTTGTVPVVCRQQHNNSNHDNNAHSTTARDYLEPRQTNSRQQQVNNYSNQQLPAYAAHLSYEAPSDGGYHRLGGPQQQQLHQQQPDEQRAIKSIGGVQNKSQTVNGGGPASSLHSGAATANPAEPQYRNGSRSSSVVSPLPAQQLPLVGGNYLANNNLHGNNQHTTIQLFQQQPTYYQQQQLPHHHHHHHHQQQQQQLHQQQQHHHHYQQQQSPYQGQHFLGNQHGLQQHHNSNHLSDHHNHHLQSESSSELRQPNANTIELITTTNIMNHQQSASDQQLVVNSSSAGAIQAPTQYTILPL